MQITKIDIENFKFHHKLNDFTISGKSCLIYGENGVGKSSIYEALKANLYNKSKLDVLDTFCNRDYKGEDLKVNIEFDSSDKYVNRVKNELDDNIGLQQQTIYMANEYDLSNLLKKDFYEVIKSYFAIYFPQTKILLELHDMLEVELKRLKNGSYEDIYKKIYEVDDKFKKVFLDLIPLVKINEIIKFVNEDFEVVFEIINSKYDDSKLTRPSIRLKIVGVEDNNDFENHFNEAKRKLISIAIFFAMAKKYEKEESELKLLVLDDFLTSLDMSNRKLIFQYILDDFEDYQKIVLTHNIQFFNLIKRLIKLKIQKWDIKTLFIIKEDGRDIAILKDEGKSYIDEAEFFLEDSEQYNLQIAGNYLRREFERIVHEFERVLEIGKVEDMQNIIDAIKHDNKCFYERPHLVLNNFLSQSIGIIKNDSIESDKKLELISKKIISISENKIDTGNSLYATIQKTEFYKNILMNPTSHNDVDVEIYKKECQSTVSLLKRLDEELKKTNKRINRCKYHFTNTRVQLRLTQM